MINNCSKKLKVFITTSLILTSLLGINNSVPHVQAGEQTLPYIEYVVKSNPSISNKSAKEIVFAAYRWAFEFNVDVRLLLAIAKVESNFYQHAISSSGAYGIMQVIPLWHKDKIIRARNELGNPEIFNINTNMYLGALILRDCMKKTSAKTSKALQCYSGQTPGYDNKVLVQYYNIQKL